MELKTEILHRCTAHKETGVSRIDTGVIIRETFKKVGKDVDINKILNIIDKDLNNFDTTNEIIKLSV